MFYLVMWKVKQKCPDALQIGHHNLATILIVTKVMLKKKF